MQNCIALAVTAAFAVSCSVGNTGASPVAYHVLLQVNGSDGMKWIDWSATGESAGSTQEAVGPLKPWTHEYRWKLTNSRRVQLTATSTGSWVACSITVNGDQRAAQRTNTAYDQAICDVTVGE